MNFCERHVLFVLFDCSLLVNSGSSACFKEYTQSALDCSSNTLYKHQILVFIFQFLYVYSSFGLAPPGIWLLTKPITPCLSTK
jgi:hypothetical protein